MKIPKFICNTENFINWPLVIDRINASGGHPNCLVGPEEDTGDDHPQGSYWDTLITAGYNWDEVTWIDFEVDIIDPELVIIFSKLVGAKTLRCFISKVDPGRCVAMHWDEGDVRYHNPQTKGNMYRYICFIKPAEIGQTLVVGDHCFHNVKYGDVFEWNHYTDFHATYNASLTPHYIFHFLGYKE